MIEIEVTVQSRAGIHARPAALITQTANKYKCDISLCRENLCVNAKSIMGVITMAAGYNTKLKLVANGEDEAEAAKAIEALFNSKFEEE